MHAELKREGEEILGCQKAGSQGNKHQMQACQGREGGEKGGKTLITWNYLLGFDTEGLVQNLCGGCDDIQG